MLRSQHAAFFPIYLRAMHAFEHVRLPPQYDRPSDIFLIMPTDGNRAAFHIWIDDETQTAFSRRVYWRRAFDEQRFKNPLKGAVYDQPEKPTLRTTDHAIPYDETRAHVTALLSVFPAQRSLDSEDHAEIQMYLRLRLPLGDAEVIRTNHLNDRPLVERCRVLHRWLMTMSRVARTQTPRFL
jgi:hypothetical protein